MNEKLLQKKGRIINQLATELLGNKVHDRMMPIMYYQKKYQTSQGTIQNAINFLKEKKAIQLVNKGYQGSFIKEINYDILQEYCLKKNLIGCMMLIQNEKMEVLASYVKQKLHDMNAEVTMRYIQTDTNMWKHLLDNTCDFVVCSYADAKSYVKKEKDLEIVVDLGYETLSSNPVLVHKNKDIQILGVIEDDAILHRIGLQFAKEKKLQMEYYTKRSVGLALYQDRIHAYIDGQEEVNFLTECQKTSIHDLYQEETRAVIVAKKNAEDIQLMIKSKLMKDDFTKFEELYKQEKLEIEY